MVSFFHKWAIAQQNEQSDLCSQRKLRQVWPVLAVLKFLNVISGIQWTDNVGDYEAW